MDIEFAKAQSELGAFLKMQRRKIPPASATLGSWKRPRLRQGRRVTQAEIAEAVGISRNLYCRLEAGTVHASMKLLIRLANTFQFTREDRQKLLLLAVLEMRSNGPRN